MHLIWIHSLAERLRRDLANRHRAAQAFEEFATADCLQDGTTSEALLGHLDEDRNRNLRVAEVNLVCWSAESKCSDHCSVDSFAPVTLVNHMHAGLLRLLARAGGHLETLVCPDEG